jgi:transposase
VPLKISRAEIRAIYAQGEEGVIALVEELVELVEGLTEGIEQLEVRLETLENQQSKTRRNGSKPPSGDGFGKRTRSLRGKRERLSGGQPEHPGRTLEWSDAVDWIETHRVGSCQGWGAWLESAPVERIKLSSYFFSRNFSSVS